MDWNKIAGVFSLILGVVFMADCIKRYNRQSYSFFVFSQGFYATIGFIVIGLILALGKVHLF